ncbi:MAG: non-canonical purine NTP pyrophosphatase [Gemmataceae bacterium]
MKQLVLGSRNKKKLRELIELLADIVPVVDCSGFPQAPEVEETAGSFLGNATLKAIKLAPVLGEWVLGEDSGLVVPSLGGAPGVDSALYAGTHGDDAGNNAKLLRELTGKANRAAYYVSTVVLSNPVGEVVASAEGRCWGRILDAARGDGGFGYDPLFEIPEYHATFAELPAIVKHALSHRGRSVVQLRPLLRRLRSSEV